MRLTPVNLTQETIHHIGKGYRSFVVRQVSYARKNGQFRPRQHLLELSA